MAFGTLLTLVFNHSSVLFFDLNVPGQLPLISAMKIYTFNFFTLWGNFNTGRILAIIILLLVVSGWRPMITGILHAWVSLSFLHAVTFIDGGDQLTALLTLFLLPLTLTDKRIWHWTKGAVNGRMFKNKYLQVFCLSIFLIIRIQVAVIYLNAAAAKLSVKEWVNGTACWYWFKDPVFGYNEWIGKIMDPMLNSPVLMSLFTWLPVILEFILFLGLFLERKYRKYLLVAGILFHFSIILIHGLVTFFCAMTAALILYLRPIAYEFSFSFFTNNKIVKIFRSYFAYKTVAANAEKLFKTNNTINE